MNISPVTSTTFRGGNVNINLPGINKNDLYNIKEYESLAKLQDIDITIEKTDMKSFYLKRYDTYNIVTSKSYETAGKTFDATSKAVIDKNMKKSVLESEIRQSVYNALKSLIQKIVIFDVENPGILDNAKNILSKKI